MNTTNEKLQPYTVQQADGIWHYPIKSDGSVYLAPVRLSDPFQVVGTGCDLSGTMYYIIDSEGERSLIARGDVGTSEGWRQLRNMINIPSARKKLDLLTEYIQHSVLSEAWEITDTAGWHKDAYILPSGEMIGKAQHTYFNGKISNTKRKAYDRSGSLQEWKSQIGNYALGNSRLCLMLGAAFAAPLLEAFGIDGGILHLYGESSSGKSTAQRMAQSVWGHGSATCESWNTTAYALTNNAAARNDGLLSMDEIGEDQNGNGVDYSIYALSNGKGRALGSKDGGNRPEIVFRVLCTSTGEVTLESHLHMHGKSVKTGQLVRCPSIPHKLETHHHFANFRAFTQHINHAVTQYYGTAGKAFIEQLSENREYWIKMAQASFDEVLTRFVQKFKLNAQITRTAALFVASHVGATLACQFGILSDVQKMQSGIECCFKEWLKENAEITEMGSIEEQRIINHVSEFMQQHSLDFAELDALRGNSNNLKGYVVRNDQGDMDYYVFTGVFKSELCKGFNAEKVKEVLHTIGWLQKAEENRWLFQLYGKIRAHSKAERLGRFYKFSGSAPDF